MATNNAINSNQLLSTTDSPTFNGLTLTSGTISSAPTAATDIVNKTYADSLINGLNWQAAAVVASTANLTATYANGASGVGATLTNSGVQAAFSSDGVTPAVNSRVLVTFQTATEENGIYTLTDVGSGATNWILTRATDFDTPAEIQPGDIVPVQQGTLYGSTTWLQTATVVTIGTDPIVFSQFSYNIQPLNKGGTSANLTANEGGIFYSTASAGAILAGTATAGQMLRSGATAAPTWSTATFPATGSNAARILRADGTNWVETTSTFADIYSASSILYANGANNIAGLATANNAFLYTNGSGVPVMTAPASATVATNDKVVIQDTDDSNNLKTVTAQSLVDIGMTNGVISLQTFFSNGTWTKPTGVKRVVVELVGGGGGGGAATNDNTIASGGGGAGYTRKIIDVTAIASESVTVGTAGAGGVGAAGGTGGTSSFGAHCSATGGVGGVLNGAGFAAGGTATGGDLNIAGQTSGVAGSPDSTTGFGYTGYGGDCMLGVGARRGNVDGNGVDSDDYGSGGGGGYRSSTTNRNGGTGGDAIVLVWEYR